MAHKKMTLGKIIDNQWSNIQLHHNVYERRIFKAIRDCRTQSLGGKKYACTFCGEEHVRWKSCRNRHCPTCQNTQREEWISNRKSELIQTSYYHVVFTLPHHLNKICLSRQREMYRILFRAAWETLNVFGWNHKYLGAQLGATMTLHTWGSDLSYHPHVHCIVPGGGITLYNKWKDAKGGDKFLFPVKAMSQVYRAKFIAQMKKAGIKIPEALNRKLYAKPWVVYAKPPFGNPETLIKYLAGYTFKTAIINARIISYDGHKVSFSYKDYRHKAKKRIMSMDVKEFLRRVSLHFLPTRFTRIRHYGILSSNWKRKLFPDAKKPEKIDWKKLWKDKGLDVNKCPNCRVGHLIEIASNNVTRGPPDKIKKKINRHGLNT